MLFPEARRWIEESAAASKQKPHLQEPEIQALRFQPLARHKHVEQFLGVSPNTVDRLIREEGLPCIRLGPGALRFDLDAVRGWALRRQLRVEVEEEGQQTDESSAPTSGKDGRKPPS